MPTSHGPSATAALILAFIAIGLLGFPLLRRSYRTAVLPPGPPRAILRPATRFEAQLRAAADWDRRAREAVNQQRERLEEWDPSTAAWLNGDAWRRQTMAEDRAGHLGRARRAALRAAALAQTTEERYRAADLLVLIEHECGRYEAELRYARLLTTLHPHSKEATRILQRALRLVKQASNNMDSFTTPLRPGGQAPRRLEEVADFDHRHAIAPYESRMVCSEGREPSHQSIHEEHKP